jgi:hypothetical protein
MIFTSPELLAEARNVQEVPEDERNDRNKPFISWAIVGETSWRYL